MTVDWIIIRGFDRREIGAIGFLGNQAAVIATFFDSADADQDGEVSVFEEVVYRVSPVDLSKRNVVDVAMAARVNEDVLRRDASFGQAAMRLWINFAQGGVFDGVYAAYFARGIGAVAGPAARRLGAGKVKEFAIRKSMEGAVRELFRDATR